MYSTLKEHFPGEKILVRPLRTISNSSNFYAKVNNDEYFIKKGRHVYREYNNLKTIQKIEHSQYRFSQVVYYENTKNILIVRYEKGNNLLKNILFKANIILNYFFNKNIKREISLAAKWLALFHNSNLLKENNITSSEHNNAISKLHQIHNILSTDEKKIITNYLDAISLESIPLCWSNHDFSPRNIIINNNEVIVVDWEKIMIKSIYYNIAYFTTNILSRSRIKLFSKTFQKNLAQLFVDSYRKHTACNFKMEHLKTTLVLYFIEYIHGYENKKGVFETWKDNTKSMDTFINSYIKSELIVLCEGKIDGHFF